MRIARPAQPLTDRWRHVPVEARGPVPLGISFRPRQVEALGLDAPATLRTLLSHPFELLRLGAYWDRIERAPDRFDYGELDWELDMAERYGKRVILCVGAVKTFGYPETFVPAHRLERPLPEGRLVEPATHPSLLGAATAFVARTVERYRDREAILAWQVEHESVDPLGVEHSWRLSAAFVAREVEAARTADPTRPIVMSGFLATTLPVRLHQWLRTRDQGDSLAVARRQADVAGVDYYPRHALGSVRGRTVYLDGSHGRALRRLPTRGRLMITEGQAEPWETVTTPPNPPGLAMHSCPPEQVIENYNRCLRWARRAGVALGGYLFWGAEYWVLRDRCGDPTYVRAFERVLGEGGPTAAR